MSTRSPSAAARTATSSWTTSPCPAITPGCFGTRAGFWVEDLNSLNGTYVNRKRIEQQRLFDGDELQIGKFKLAFVGHRDEMSDL